MIARTLTTWRRDTDDITNTDDLSQGRWLHVGAASWRDTRPTAFMTLIINFGRGYSVEHRENTSCWPRRSGASTKEVILLRDSSSCPEHRTSPEHQNMKRSHPWTGTVNQYKTIFVGIGCYISDSIIVGPLLYLRLILFTNNRWEESERIF